MFFFAFSSCTTGIRHLGNFESQVSLLATQLVKNTKISLSRSAIIIGTIQDLNNLDKTNDLGRLISECLIYNLQVKGFVVKDIRLLHNIVIKTKKGEFVLSRDAQKLRHDIKANYILVGTYALADEGVVVNLRLLDFNSLVVISTAQTIIPIQYVASFLNNSETGMTKIKLVGEGK